MYGNAQPHGCSLLYDRRQNKHENFCGHGNRSWSDTVKFVHPVNLWSGATIRSIYPIQIELQPINFKYPYFCYHGNVGWLGQV